MDCSLPGSSIHGIFQARILEWVAVSFSRGSPQPKNQTWVSCTAGRLYHLSHQGSPELLLGALHILENVTPTDFLTNEDHVDRNKSITAISIVRSIFKKNLYFRYQTLIVILINMDSPIFKKYPRSFLATFSELYHY